MYFVVFATDKPGMAEVRDYTRPSHRTYLRQHDSPVKVVLGGPTLGEVNNKMNGTMLVIEAENIKQVRNYVDNDPYNLAGMFQSIDIRPWLWGLGTPEE